jgi:hypothetical protein
MIIMLECREREKVREYMVIQVIQKGQLAICVRESEELAACQFSWQLASAWQAEDGMDVERRRMGVGVGFYRSASF